MSLTGNNTATGSNNFAAYIRLGGNVYIPNGTPVAAFDFSTNVNGDSFWDFTGSPYSSGPGIGADILGKIYNSIDTNVQTNVFGY